MPSLMNEWTSDSLLDDMKKLTEAVMSLFVAACGPCTVCMCILPSHIMSYLTNAVFAHSDWFHYLVLTSPWQMLKWP